MDVTLNGLNSLNFQKIGENLKKVNRKINILSDIGRILIGFGVSFEILGVLFYFDGGFLALGNIFLLTGLFLNLGMLNCFSFFFSTKRIFASLLFFTGVSFVMMRWPVFGIVIEFFGFIYLFGFAFSFLKSLFFYYLLFFRGFFPAVMTLLRNLPYVGYVFFIFDLILVRLFMKCSQETQKSQHFQQQLKLLFSLDLFLGQHTWELNWRYIMSL